MTQTLEKHKDKHDLVATRRTKGKPAKADLRAQPARPNNARAGSSNTKQQQEAISAFRQKIDMTLRDPISGLLNCDGFMKLYREAFSFRNDTQGPLHCDEHGLLLLLDIENYPLIEDVYGDAVAQNCLREIGDILNRFVKQEDVVGRLRDDQFALMMRNTSLHQAMERLHKLSSSLIGVEVKAGTTRISLKVNIGLKPFRPGDTAEATLAGADLYKQTMIEEDRVLDKQRAIKTRGLNTSRSDQQVNRGNQTVRQAMS